MTTTINDTLQETIQQQDLESLVRYLTQLPTTEKGDAFERALGMLLSGNGYVVSSQGGRGDGGADLVLSSHESPEHPLQIVQAKNHARPLSFDETLTELKKFEYKAQEQYHCNFFSLYSISGFVKDAYQLERFNMKLYGPDEIASLMAQYDPSRKTVSLDLLPHNHVAYQSAVRAFETEDRVTIVHATGTGKSYLIAKLLTDYLGQSILFLAPSHTILDQFKAKFSYLLGNVTVMTYAKLQNNVPRTRYDWIVLDEYHRCGAEKWGDGVDQVLSMHQGKVFGTTATPVQYLDGEKDMAKALGLQTVSELSLVEAIARRVIEKPTYVSGLYTLDEEIERCRDRTQDSQLSSDEKDELYQQLEQLNIDWRQSSGPATIIKTHASDVKKCIVFCSDIKMLMDMELTVQQWFRDSGLMTRSYRVYSEYKESAKQLEAFKSEQTSDIQILFSIDMLNEGLHMPDIDAVIFLRTTCSPRIYYQQMGRCIQVGQTKAPLILDLVNNFKNVKSVQFKQDLETAIQAEATHRKTLGLEPNAVRVSFTDYTHDTYQLLQELSLRLDGWDIRFQQVADFVQSHQDWPKTRAKDPHEKQLAAWMSNQRTVYKNNKIEPEKINRLEGIGFVWNSLEAAWNQAFSELQAFYTTHQVWPVTGAKDSHEKQLANWMNTQRQAYKKNTLAPEKVKRLEGIDFDWDAEEAAWNQGFSELQAFYAEHQRWPLGTTTDPHVKQLATWMSNQRQAFKKNTLEPAKVKRLEDIGFEWNADESAWNQGFSELQAFYTTHHRWPVNGAKDRHENQLATWASTQRKAYKKNTLEPEKVTRLEGIGFEWDAFQAAWNKNFSELQTFYAEHHRWPLGTAKDPHEKQLANWMSNQRKAYKKNTLAPEKITRLEGIGFEWTGR